MSNGIISLLDQFGKMNSLHPVSWNRLNQHMENVLDSHFSQTPSAVAVNVRETEGSYTFEVDVPGVSKEDISLGVEDGILTISGQRSISEDIHQEYIRVESAVGKFERAFKIPSSAVDTENITAVSKDGVLSVNIPKKNVTPGTIKIQ
jgi:HSP20 family protein